MMKKQATPASHLRPLAAVTHAVLNPFDAPPTKGCFGDGPRSTAVQKRKATYSMTFLPGGAVETEVFIVFNDARDPYIVSKSGTQVTLLNGGRDITDPNNHTVPLGSMARIVCAEVRLEYVGVAQDLGGVIFHFPTDPDDQTNEAGIFDGTWGSCNNQVEMAVSHTRMKNTVQFIKPPEHDFRPVSYPTYTSATGHAEEELMWAAGMPLSLQPTIATNHADVGRFLITGGHPIPVIITICSHIEYYHIGHHAFSTPRVTHQAGSALSEMLSTKMLLPGSNNTIKSKGWLERIISGADSVLGMTGAANSIMGYVKNPKSLFTMQGAIDVGTAMAGLFL